ncbi:MAG: mqnA [Chthoniobacter sp.]|nr:mqnA [Chthoniobacter sp.]
MNRYPALAGVRVGCVQYLNSKPLIHGCDVPVTFDHPSGLARALAAGELDVALVPVFEALRTPGYVAVDGVAIASDGPVFSVFLAYRGRLEDIRTISLDPASLTSAHLLQVLLAEFHGLRPDFVHSGDGIPDAALLIGNQAIEFRTHDHHHDHEFLDLGEEWKRQTGLPFVYALWLMRGDLEEQRAVADDLRALKRDGVQHISEIVAADTTHNPALSTRYLTEHIRYDLGEREKTAIARFRELLVKYGLVADAGSALEWI